MDSSVRTVAVVELQQLVTARSHLDTALVREIPSVAREIRTICEERGLLRPLDRSSRILDEQMRGGLGGEGQPGEDAEQPLVGRLGEGGRRAEHLVDQVDVCECAMEDELSECVRAVKYLDLLEYRVLMFLFLQLTRMLSVVRTGTRVLAERAVSFKKAGCVARTRDKE